MREEISEPQHWRSRSSRNRSWTALRRASTMPLPAEVVDAAFTDEGPLVASRLDAAEIEGPIEGTVVGDATTYPELIASLTEQLAQLEAHREHLQKLLAETSDRQS